MKNKELLRALELKLMGYEARIKDLEQEIQRLKNEKEDRKFRGTSLTPN